MPSVASTAFLGLIAASSALAHSRRGHSHNHYYNGTDPVYSPSASNGPTGTGVSTITSTSLVTSVETVLMTLPGSSVAAAADTSSDPVVTNDAVQSSSTSTITVASSVFEQSAGVCTPATVYVTETERVTISLSATSAYSYGSDSSVAASAYTPTVRYVTVIPSAISVAPVPTVDTTTEAAPTVAAVVTPTSSTIIGVAATTTAPADVPAVVESVAATTASTEVPVVVESVATTSTTAPAVAAQQVKVVSTSSSSAAAVPTVDSVVAVSSSSKRGIVYNLPQLANCFFSSSSQVSWAYNWGQLPNELNGVQVTPQLNPTVQFIPMLWGNKDVFTTPWVANAKAMIAAGSPAVLGFNEPDHPDQANMPVISSAATLYKSLITDNFSGKARLGSPAVTNGVTNANGGVMGLGYLTQFLSACSDCAIDFAVIHWYDSATNFAYFKTHIETAHTDTGLPLWITEFSASGSDEQIAAFLAQALPWLDSLSYVERYSYYMADATTVAGTSLNPVGQAYATTS